MTRRAETLVFLVLAIAGCSDVKEIIKHRVTFIAHEDDRRLPEVGIRIAGRRVGSTDAQGELRVDIPGPDGANVVYGIACPAGHRTPTDPPPLRCVRVRATDSAPGSAARRSAACAAGSADVPAAAE